MTPVLLLMLVLVLVSPVSSHLWILTLTLMNLWLLAFSGATRSSPTFEPLLPDGLRQGAHLRFSVVDLMMLLLLVVVMILRHWILVVLIFREMMVLRMPIEVARRVRSLLHFMTTPELLLLLL